MGREDIVDPLLGFAGSDWRGMSRFESAQAFGDALVPSRFGLLWIFRCRHKRIEVEFERANQGFFLVIGEARGFLAKAFNCRCHKPIVSIAIIPVHPTSPDREAASWQGIDFCGAFPLYLYRNRRRPDTASVWRAFRKDRGGGFFYLGQVITCISQCEMSFRQAAARGLSVSDLATAPHTMSASWRRLLLRESCSLTLRMWPPASPGSLA